MHVAAAQPNVAPTLDLDADNSTTLGADYLTGFTEGGAAVAIADADAAVSEPDSTNIVSATITLTNPQTDDLLSVSGLPAGISASAYDPATGILTLSGSDSLANYETALQLIQFSNSNIDPSNVTRVINIVVNDGVSNSNTAKAFIQVEAVNNAAPVVDLDSDNSGGSFRSHRERRPGTNRRSRYHHHRCRQHQPCFGDDHTDEPTDRRSARCQRGAAGSDHRVRLRSPYRHPHAHRLGHAG